MPNLLDRPMVGTNDAVVNEEDGARSTIDCSSRANVAEERRRACRASTFVLKWGDVDSGFKERQQFIRVYAAIGDDEAKNLVAHYEDVIRSLEDGTHARPLRRHLVVS